MIRYSRERDRENKKFKTGKAGTINGEEFRWNKTVDEVRSERGVKFRA